MNSAPLPRGHSLGAKQPVPNPRGTGTTWRRLSDNRRPVKKARLSGGPDDSAIYFYVNAGAPFPSDFHIRFSHTPTFLDCHIGLADALPDCHVGSTGAAFAAKRPDTVSVAHFRSARGQRKNGGTCQCRRDSQNVSCTHLGSPCFFSTHVNARMSTAVPGIRRHFLPRSCRV